MVLAAQRIQRIPDGVAFNFRIIVGPQNGHFEKNQENSANTSDRNPFRVREIIFIRVQSIRH